MTPRLVLIAVVAALLPTAPAHAGPGPALSVDASLNRHAISPDVYGINGAAPSLQTELGLTADRWGGNTASRYNWTNNTHNTGSITLLVLPTDGSTPTPVATSLTAPVSPSISILGTTVTMSGRLAAGSLGAGGRAVVLEGRRSSTTTWADLGTVASAPDGTVSRTFAPPWSGTLRWRFAGDASYLASTSPGVEGTVVGMPGGGP